MALEGIYNLSLQAMDILGKDTFIGYEYKNPFFSFHYIPLEIEVNKLYARLVDGVGLNPYRIYYLYFFVQKNSFSLVVKPIFHLNEVVKFLILDTFIEQRKYIRLYLKREIFDVFSDHFTGFLKDISPKGFRIRFREFPPVSWFNHPRNKKFKLLFPDKTVLNFNAVPVQYDASIKEAIFMFSSDIWHPTKNPSKIYLAVYEFLKKNPLFQEFVDAGFRKPRFKYPIEDLKD